MKKILAFAMLLAMVASCGNKQQKGSAETDEFLVDSASYDLSDGKVVISIDVDFPKTTGTPLSDSIRQHVSNMLGGTYQGDKNDSQAMIDFYGNSLAEGFKADMEDIEGGLAWQASTSFKLYQTTPHYVTFSIDTYEFTGGAHGLGASFYTTYDRETGRTFGYDLLKDTQSDAFLQLVKEGLKDYFSEMGDSAAPRTTDEELEGMLLLTDGADVDHLPLPGLEPSLSDAGITFVYTPYEIAPYAGGQPSFTIPYDKIRPFLTEEALKWIE